MRAQIPDVSDAPAAHNDHKNGGSGGFDEAMENLVEAISERKVEPIRIAYLGLRSANGKIPTREILDCVGRSITSKSGSVWEMIVSAFSHGHCVMCNDGVSPCRTCHGSGMVNDYVCPDCDGLGIEVCMFCAGTGWSDHHDIPAEIRPDAILRRIKHVKKDLAILDKVSEADMLASAEKLDPHQKRELASRLIRLQARLTRMAGVEVGNDTEHVAPFSAAAARIKRFLEALRLQHPQDEENQ
ncbi:MAG: hypothetical protein KAV00_12665 [Phycisphaerae bacterium]|nr:hypothetical protein [Phycisphaerae bacterium]